MTDRNKCSAGSGDAAVRLLAAEDERQSTLHEILETIREQIRLEVAPEHRPEGLFKNIQDAVYAMRGRTRLMDDAAITHAIQSRIADGRSDSPSPAIASPVAPSRDEERGRTFAPAQAVGVRLATIEECAKIAEYNGWERTAEQIRALASQPSPAATVEVSKEIPADMRLIVSALKGRFFECGGHMREMSENEAFDIALALRRAKEDHEWCSAATGDAQAETSRLPRQHLDASKWPSKAAMEASHARLSAATERETALEAAALDFIAKVDRGEARSKHSYAAFKAALALTRPLLCAHGVKIGNTCVGCMGAATFSSHQLGTENG